MKDGPAGLEPATSGVTVLFARRRGRSPEAYASSREVVPELVELEAAVPPASSAPLGSVRGDPPKIEGGTAVKKNGIARAGRGRSGGCVAAACAGGAGRAGRGREGRAACAQCRCRPRCPRRADGRRGRRGRRPQGSTRCRSGRGASRSRGGRGDPRRAARPGGAAAGAHGRRLGRAGAADLRAFRRPRSADRGGVGADARRRFDAPLPPRSRSRSAARSSRRPVDVEVGGLACVRRAHPGGARRADGPPPRRRQVGGADARRDRAEGPHQRRRARDHVPTAPRSRSGSGKARPRTRPSRLRCSPIWSTAASIPSRGSCS